MCAQEAVIPAEGDITSDQPVFECREESDFYSICLRHFIFKNKDTENIIEFGSGHGLPVLQALHSTLFKGSITGFETSLSAASMARKHIALFGKEGLYQVHNDCFFESFKGSAQEFYLIANPPYIPALDSGRLLMPELWGGPDGADILCRLLERSFKYVLLLIPGISNPSRVIGHALRQGYRVQNYLTTPLPYGMYTSQKYVQTHLHTLRRQQQAFFYETYYLLAGVLFCTETPCMDGLEESLLNLLASGTDVQL